MMGPSKRSVGFPPMGGEEEMMGAGAPPAPAMPPEAAPEAAPDAMGGELADMIKMAVDEGLAGVTAPQEAAAVLRELADMLESGV